MSPAKVTLSPKERELVTDASFILTKNAIIGKVYDLFGQLSEKYSELYQQSSLSSLALPGFTSPKISRGEQYLGLPWVMLDQPRHFTKEDTLAVRSFFWWGNFCSITLQLSGISQARFAPQIASYFSNHPSAISEWSIGTGEDPWQHHFGEDNYKPLCADSMSRLASMYHIKLAKKIALTEWDVFPEFYAATYREILVMLSGN